MKAILAAAAALSLVGCATVLNDREQAVRIDTKSATGESIAGADCVIMNEYGSKVVKSGSSQAVRRSSNDLDISCTHPGLPPALGRARSRANLGLAGNLIAGGIVGAVVDHNMGTGYSYPTWIELAFGQSLVFDRSDERTGTVLKGYAFGSRSEKREPTAYSAGSSACSQQAQGVKCASEGEKQMVVLQPPAVATMTTPPPLGRNSRTSHACMNQLPGVKCD